jgi:hypothetical protein
MGESMFELTREYKYLLEMLEEESDDETVKAVISDTLELLEGDIEAKADSIAYIKRKLDADEEMLKKEEQRLRARRESIVKNRQRLVESLMEAMRAMGKEKFKTTYNSFGIRKAGGNVPVILDCPPEKLPDRFQKISIEADIPAIRAHLSANSEAEFSWAHLGERSEYLSIR